MKTNQPNQTIQAALNQALAFACGAHCAAIVQMFREEFRARQKIPAQIDAQAIFGSGTVERLREHSRANARVFRFSVPIGGGHEIKIVGLVSQGQLVHARASVFGFNIHHWSDSLSRTQRAHNDAFGAQLCAENEETNQPKHRLTRVI